MKIGVEKQFERVLRIAENLTRNKPSTEIPVSEVGFDLLNKLKNTSIRFVKDYVTKLVFGFWERFE